MPIGYLDPQTILDLLFQMAFQKNSYFVESHPHKQSYPEKGGVEDQLLLTTNPIRGFPKIGHYSYLHPTGVVKS